ncbi:hypothetical protein B0T19DRAFT_6491 [Cercophora scortea]|uniref:Uncharacterized protein n=1 Tax=Cercophora scortea TaxID=314031 RepID=A0AAE0J1W2_9PEZI|nr:hypothetical protein B0T19DRAFT_6491 [Cercophora scortea]
MLTTFQIQRVRQNRHPHSSYARLAHHDRRLEQRRGGEWESGPWRTSRPIPALLARLAKVYNNGTRSRLAPIVKIARLDRQDPGARVNEHIWREMVSLTQGLGVRVCFGPAGRSVAYLSLDAARMVEVSVAAALSVFLTACLPVCLRVHSLRLDMVVSRPPRPRLSLAGKGRRVQCPLASVDQIEGKTDRKMGVWVDMMLTTDSEYRGVHQTQQLQPIPNKAASQLDHRLSPPVP